MLKWVFGADTSPFRRSLNEMRNDVKQFSATAGGQLAGMFAGGALLAGVNALIGQFARIQDLADRFGESAESVQRVGVAAAQAGSDTENIVKALTAATRNATEAASGSDELADAFGRLGINAANFTSLSLEDKLLALSAGYGNSSSQAQGLTDIMKVMGKQGAEAIPLLTQGAESLAEELKNATIAGNGTVAMLAAIDDKLASAKQTVSVIGAYTLVAVVTALKSVGAIWLGVVGNFITGATTIVGSFVNLGTVIGRTLSGDLSGAKDAAAKYFKDIQKGIDGIVRTTVATGSVVSGIFGDAFSGGPAKDNSEAKAAQKLAEEMGRADEERAKRLKDIDGERKKLKEEIAALEQEANMKNLSLAEKIADAEKRRVQFMEAANGGDVPVTVALEARKQQLEVEKEISGYRKEQAESATKAKDEKDKRTESARALALEAKAEEAKAHRDNKFNRLDNKGKIGMLQGERKQLLDDAAKLMADGSDTTIAAAYKKRAEAAGIQGQIDGLSKNSSAGPIVMSEDLRKMGGGGRGAVISSPANSTDGRLDKVINLLSSIDRKTNESGGIGPEPF